MKTLIILVRMFVSMSMIGLTAMLLLGMMAYYGEPEALYCSLVAIATIVVGLVAWCSTKEQEKRWMRS